jgi:hypothetical protein
LDWYENNVEKNLNNDALYEKLGEDPTTEVKDAFDRKFDEMLENKELPAKTHEFLTTGDAKLGVFYENPKTHKFQGIPSVKLTVPEEGYPSRGIKSDLKTATEKPGDWVDFHINPGMKKLKSFVQDTDNMLQKIEEINESGIINDETNLLGLDVIDMYNNMPR